MSDHLEVLGRGTFAENGLNLWHLGFAVLPAQGKKPLIKFHGARQSRYGMTAVCNFALRMPEANIAYQPGLSIPVGDEEYRLLVLDSDDLFAAEQSQNVFGQTSGTWTNRGRHDIYKIHFSELGEITRIVGTGGDLRKVGLNVDVKHGSSIVMAGGSWHPSGKQYQWDGPDVHGELVGDDFLRSAAVFDSTLLADLVGVRSRLVSVDGAPLTYNRTDGDDDDDGSSNDDVHVDGIETEWRSGSRKLGLNDYLIRHVSGCGGFDALLEHAHEFNGARCSLSLKGQLDDDVVEEITQRAFEDHLKDPKAKWSGGPATAQMMPWEATGRVCGPQANRTTRALALQLLMHLRVCHGAKNGRPFAISAKAMAEANSIEGWKRDHYIKARTALIEAGTLVQVRQASTGKSALFKLTPARLHPAGRTA